MISVKIKVRDLDKISGLLSKDIAVQIFEKSQENIDKMDIIASGYLKRSGRIEKVDFNAYRIVYDAPYAIFVEYGTLPHMPPIEPLIQWAKKKFGVNDKEARRIAWLVANKIKEGGTKPKPFLRNAIDEVKSDIKFKRFRLKYIRLG